MDCFVAIAPRKDETRIHLLAEPSILRHCERQRSNPCRRARKNGLLRRFAPRNDAVATERICCPTGKSPGLSIDPSVQPPLQKYSDFPKTQISFITLPSCPTEGRLEIVTDAGQDAVDAISAKDEGACLADGEVVWS